jgi:hypothetical protein
MIGSQSVRRALGALALATTLLAGAANAAAAPTPPAGTARTILFVGNSYMHAAWAATWKFRPQTVTDLNGTGYGGVPAMFKAMTEQAGLNYAVSLETLGGSDLGRHRREKTALIDKAWDHVVMNGYSTIDQEDPGNPANLIRDSSALAEMWQARNPNVDVRLNATWSRADQTYLSSGHWYGQPIAAHGRDVRAAADKAAAASPALDGVIPIGDAWARAWDTGFADTNPYDGIQFGQVSLWTFDHHHGSIYGYYLEALMVFGAITGKDPRALGRQDSVAVDLGISQPQTAALQQIAYDTLVANKLLTPEPAAARSAG